MVFVDIEGEGWVDGGDMGSLRVVIVSISISKTEERQSTLIPPCFGRFYAARVEPEVGE